VLPENWSSGLGALVLALIANSPVAAQPAPLGCLMEPDRVAEIGSPVVGVIDSIAVERGDRVRKGQTLAMLKADVERASVNVAHARAESEADVRSAQANVEFTRAKLARSEELVRQDFIARQALEQVRAEAQVAEQRLALAREQQRVWRAEHELAQQQLGQRMIRAPFDGIVSERYVSVGERIEEKPAFRVVKIDPLRVEVVVPSSLYGSIQPGMTAQILPDLPGATKRDARVVLVDKVIDGASNTFRVRAEIPNANAALPSGLRCKAELATQGAIARDTSRPAGRTEPRAGSTGTAGSAGSAGGAHRQHQAGPAGGVHRAVAGTAGAVPVRSETAGAMAARNP
jgi:RND family efflux transporter MFP subunit